MTESVDQLRQFMKSLGLTADVDPELGQTPERVDALLRELFSGLHSDPPRLSFFDATQQKEPVFVSDIQFRSTCAHHLLPILGTIDIAYIPGEKMAGFGGFARVIDHWSKRPQVQERLIEDICDDLFEQLQPRGLLIRLEARQLCVEMRNDRPPSLYRSWASRGNLVDGARRNEVLRALTPEK